MQLFGPALFFSANPEWGQSEEEQEDEDSPQEIHYVRESAVHFMNYYNPEQHGELLRDKYQT